LTLLALASLPLHLGNLKATAQDKDRILAVAQKMESAFKNLEDYTCEVEQIFYQDGVENQRYLFKFYFKKEKKIRVDFSQPHSGLVIFYHDKDKEATVMPLRLVPGLKFRLSVDNPLMKTLAGQRINQTDMGYFIRFMFKNLKSVEQKENDFREDDERVEFLFWAMDYIEEKFPEKYRISVSKKYWLPIRIERYNLEGKRLEVTDIRNYVLNAHLEDKLFMP
jgi:outer membrane lipoprotein-sorting protein